jgi:hypothetical protein
VIGAVALLGGFVGSHPHNYLVAAALFVVAFLFWHASVVNGGNAIGRVRDVVLTLGGVIVGANAYRWGLGGWGFIIACGVVALTFFLLGLWKLSRRTRRDAVLAKCDLYMTRDELADGLRMMIAQVEREGQTLWMSNELRAAHEAFLTCPSIETARALLRVAPFLLKWFEMCSPGTAHYSSVRMLKERGLER